MNDRKRIPFTPFILLACLLPVAAEAERFAGSGQQATPKFTMSKGAYVISCEHQGSGYFGVWLIDESGTDEKMIANLVGRATVSKAVGIPAHGSYLLNIKADGYWTVDVSKALLLPSRRSFSGKASQATCLFVLDGGAYRFRAKHDGKGNFIVNLIEVSEGPVDVVANEIGDCDVSKVSKLESGTYVMNITADGSWTVDIKSP